MHPPETPEQQAPPETAPPRPSLQIGNHTLTAEQVAECVDRSCAGCHGTGFRRQGKRRSICACVLRGMAVRYGDAEDRRRYGVSTPAERIAHEMTKRASWNTNKTHHLGARVESLEAQERELLAIAEEAAKHLRARREAVSMAIESRREGIAQLEKLEASLRERIERTRQELRLLEAQAADAFASRAMAIEGVTEYERDLAAIDAEAATVNEPNDRELARVRKELDKARRRLGIHTAYNGAAS